MEIHIEKEELAGYVREIVDDMFDHVLKRKKPETIVIKTGGPDYTSFGTYNSGLSEQVNTRISGSRVPVPHHPCPRTDACCGPAPYPKVRDI